MKRKLLVLLLSTVLALSTAVTASANPIDPHEPNNSIGTATPLPQNFDMYSYISYDGDDDYFLMSDVTSFAFLRFAPPDKENYLVTVYEMSDSVNHKVYYQDTIDQFSIIHFNFDDQKDYVLHIKRLNGGYSDNPYNLYLLPF